MKISAILKDGCKARSISMNVPTINHPVLPVTYVDSRWARPYVFHDIFNYPLSETTDVQQDFSNLVNYANLSLKRSNIERYLEGLLKIVDEHIYRCGRVLFCDLLMYVDCLSYLCFASNLMTEEQIKQNYPCWVKSIVESRKNSIKCSSKWDVTAYAGSYNEDDLNACFS